MVLDERPAALAGSAHGEPGAAAETVPGKEEAGEGEAAHAEHYWGQALQYLDRVVAVEPGRKGKRQESSPLRVALIFGVSNENLCGQPAAPFPAARADRRRSLPAVMLLARRDGAKVRFSLRQGVGRGAGRAPWKVEWGGGASVENPHFQRVHYCDLLVRDFLQRCRSARFPSVERDVSMVLAHCGSLLLDAAAVQEAGHELVVLERMHAAPEFSPGASLEALTRRPLRTC